MVYRTTVALDLLQTEVAKLLLSIHDFSPKPLDNIDERKLRRYEQEYPHEGDDISIRQGIFKQQREGGIRADQEGQGNQNRRFDDQALLEQA